MVYLYGQMVIGPPGSGKTTYCREMAELLKKLGRKVAIVNIDPANDVLTYTPSIDISELITVQDTMIELTLGPNGGLVFCVEYLEKNIDWLLSNIAKFPNHYFLIDCPGQVELYTHHPSMKKIVGKLQSSGMSLCTVHIVDSHCCSDPGKFISSLLLTLTTMLNMELPHVSILSKVDMMKRFADQLPFSLEYYTEVMDLSYLLEWLQDDPLYKKYSMLNKMIVQLVEDFSLVSFIPLSIKDNRMLLKVKKEVDKANGYVYNAGEEQNVQALLACAVGAESEQERLGVDRDLYST